LQSTSNLVAPTAAVPTKLSNTTKKVLQKNPQRKNEVNKVQNPKSSQTSGENYDTKLVEMINTAIVDRSPSVRWDDVGKNLHTFAFFTFMYYRLFDS
jgi:spastin